MTFEFYVDGTDRASKLLSTSFSRQNKLGIGSFNVVFEDYGYTLYGLFAQNQTVKIKNNGKYIFYGFITGMTRNDNDTLSVSGTSYKGRFNKTRPIYQFYDTDRKEIAQKLITKSICDKYIGTTSISVSDWTFSDSDYLIAVQIAPNSDYQFIDKIRIWMKHSNYGNDRSDKPFLFAAVYPDNGSDYPNLAGTREALSFVETAIYWDPKSHYPVDIDFKQLVDVSTAKKWLVFGITDEKNANVILKVGNPTNTFVTRYSTDSGTSWSATTANPALEIYGLKRSNLDIKTFETDTNINYSIEHNPVSSALKELSEGAGKSFFDKFGLEGGLFTYLKLDNNTTDEYSNTVWNPTNITYSTGHTGAANTAAVFNGSSSVIFTSANYTCWTWAGEFAISFWVYFPASIFGVCAYSYMTTNGWTIVSDNNGFKLYIGSLGHIISDAPLTVGAWHHIVIQRDATNEVSIHIDKVKQAETMVITDIISDSVYTKVSMGHPFVAIDGKMDDIGFFKDISLTQSEIDRLYADTLDMNQYNRYYEDDKSGIHNLYLHWESSTTTPVSNCKIEEGVNLLDNNLHDTEIINLCKVYGKDQNGNEILATYQDDTSIGTYGIKEYVIRRDNINTFDDCYNYAKGVVENFKDVNIAGHVMINWSRKASYNTDDLFPNLISIKIPSKSIDSTYVAQRITWNFPDHTVRIDFAEDINVFEERMSTLYSDVGGRKQTKNLQASDNTLSMDFTQERSVVETFLSGTISSTRLSHNVGVGLLGDDVSGYNFTLKGIETNQSMLNYKCSLLGDFVDNSFIIFKGGNAPIIDNPISQTHISTGNYEDDFTSTGTYKIDVSLNPRIMYGTNGRSIFEINMKGQAREIYTEVATTPTDDIFAMTSIEGGSDSFKLSDHKGFLVTTRLNSIASYSSDWKQVSAFYNLTSNTSYSGIPLGVVAIYGNGAGTTARRYIVLIACYTATGGRLAIYWLSEDLTTFSNDNTFFNIEADAWWNTEFGSSYIHDMTKENNENNTDCRFFGVLKDTTDNHDRIIPFNLDYSSSFLSAAGWNLSYYNGAIRPAGQTYQPNYVIYGIDCFANENITGSTHILGGRYNLVIADIVNATAHSNIAFNFIDHAYPQMPYRYEYFESGNLFFAFRSITHGPAKCILRGLELKMMANHTIYDIPKYLSIGDYL